MKPLHFPNYITFARLFLIPFFFTAMVSYQPGKEYQRWLAFGIFLTASLTDALDGFLARLTKSRSRLGRFLDPLADKLLLLSGYLGLLFVPSLPYRPPLWVTVTIVFRDVVIIGGLVMIFLLTGRVKVEPNFLGKATTAFQMVTLIAILLVWKISVALWYATAGLTIVSCLVYCVRELRLIQNGG